MRPRVLYASSGGVSIAYQVVGSGAIDVVFQPGFVSHLDLAWEEPFFTRFLEGLAGFSRVIWFDKRGTGLSDPAGPDVPVEDRLADIRSVMDAAGARRAALFGVSEGAALSALFAATDPGRVSALILWAGFARLVADDDDCPGWSRDFFDAFLAGLDQARADGTGIGVPNPSIRATSAIATGSSATSGRRLALASCDRSWPPTRAWTSARFSATSGPPRW